MASVNRGKGSESLEHDGLGEIKEGIPVQMMLKLVSQDCMGGVTRDGHEEGHSRHTSGM